MDIGDFNEMSTGNHVQAICGLDVGSDFIGICTYTVAISSFGSKK